MLKSIDVSGEVINQNQRLLSDLNNRCHNRAEVRQLLSEITDNVVDESVEVRLPFFTDYGRNIKLGKDIFINSNVTLVDLGGINLEDRVLIGPGATLISVNHVEDSKYRRNLELNPVVIKEGAWIGAKAVILPGVTVGENAIVGAGSIVTKDVKKNTIVVGSPAKELRKIKENGND